MRNCQKKRQIFIKMSVLVIAMIALFPSKSNAEEPNPLGFTVQAIRPDTQVEVNKTYFFIETKPDVSQVLKVRLKGMKKEAVKVKAFVTNAVTSSSGNIDYVADTKEIDQSLKQPLTEITTFNETEITLENFEEKIIEVVVTPPKESYDGIKLGALVFELVEAEETNKQAVSAKYQYRIGLVTTETGEDYENAKALDLVSAKLGLKLGKKQVSAVIHNPEPKIADNLKVEAVVTKKGSDQVLKKTLVENARMAPNSTYDLLIDWGVDAVKEGNYVVKVHAQNDQEDWRWQKEFTVSGDSARKMNKETDFQLVLPKWIPLAVIAAISVIVIVVILLTIRSSNWRQQIKERAKKRKAQREKKRTKRKSKQG